MTPFTDGDSRWGYEVYRDVTWSCEHNSCGYTWEFSLGLQFNPCTLICREAVISYTHNGRLRNPLCAAVTHVISPELLKEMIVSLPHHIKANMAAVPVPHPWPWTSCTCSMVTHRPGSYALWGASIIFIQWYILKWWVTVRGDSRGQSASASAPLAPPFYTLLITIEPKSRINITSYVSGSRVSLTSVQLM